MCAEPLGKPDYLDTLAAAYAAASDFASASKWQTKANASFPIVRAKKDGEMRLKMYQSKNSGSG